MHLILSLILSLYIFLLLHHRLLLYHYICSETLVPNIYHQWGSEMGETFLPCTPCLRTTFVPHMTLAISPLPSMTILETSPQKEKRRTKIIMHITVCAKRILNRDIMLNCKYNCIISLSAHGNDRSISPWIIRYRLMLMPTFRDQIILCHDLAWPSSENLWSASVHAYSMIL